MSIPCDKAFPSVPNFFTLTVTFDLHFKKHWTVRDRAFIFHMCIPCYKPFSSVQNFVTLAVIFDLHFENFDLKNYFETVRYRAFIFHMRIPCDMTIPLVPYFLTLWPWPLPLTYILKTDKNFNLDHKFWTVRNRAFIFHMGIPCDNIFLSPNFLTLWPWKGYLTYILKTLTFIITFEL